MTFFYWILVCRKEIMAWRFSWQNEYLKLVRLWKFYVTFIAHWCTFHIMASCAETNKFGDTSINTYSEKCIWYAYTHKILLAFQIKKTLGPRKTWVYIKDWSLYLSIIRLAKLFRILANLAAASSKPKPPYMKPCVAERQSRQVKLTQ